MERSFDKLQDLVTLHTQYMNPSHNFGHITVAAALIEKRITTPEEYLQVCSNQGISTYKSAALEYFKTVKLPGVKKTLQGELEEGDLNKHSDTSLELLNPYN